MRRSRGSSAGRRSAPFCGADGPKRGVADAGPRLGRLGRAEAQLADRRAREGDAAEHREASFGDAAHRPAAGLDQNIHGLYTNVPHEPDAPSDRPRVPAGHPPQGWRAGHPATDDAADAAAIASFARSLPEDDLLFLRMDITDPEAVAHWMRNLEAGLTTTVIAETGGAIAGYAALVQNRVGWQRHLGEIRTQVALPFRSQGLGRALAGRSSRSPAAWPPQDRGPDDARPERGDGHLRAARVPARGPAAGLRGGSLGAHARPRGHGLRRDRPHRARGLAAVPAKNRLDPIPQPPRTMLLGNLLALGTTAPIQDMMRLAREYGPIYWLDMMGKPVVVVSGFSLVDELCDETRFDKSVRARCAGCAPSPATASSPRTPTSRTGREAHNILLPNFGQRAMQGYHPMMLDIAEQLVLKWERLNADDEIDVTHDMTSLTLDTIGLCGFGYRFNSFYRDSNHPFVDAMIGALGASMETRGLPLESFDQEGPGAPAPRRHPLHERDGGPHHPGAAARAATTWRGKPDLLSCMLSGVDRKSGRAARRPQHPLPGHHLPDRGARDDQRAALVRALLPAAEPGRAGPRLRGGRPRARARIRPCPPTYAQVNQLTYLGQVLKESLRLWPTAPGLRALAPTRTR